MNPFRFFILCFFIAIGLSAHLTGCGKKQTDQNVWSEQNDTLSRKSNETIYYVWVDNLRARKRPGKDGEVVCELKNMEQLIYLNEKSDFTEEVNLRGRIYNEPWLKVKLPDGETGWVFGGGVTTSMEQAMESDEWLVRPGQGVGRIRIGETIREAQIAYGKDQVKKQQLFIPEGESSDGFVVFPNQPNQLECFTDNKGKIELIRITGKASSWHTAEGIRIGTMLEELVELNGKPVEFSGFGWDYGGGVTSFNKGTLEKFSTGLSLTLIYPEEGFPNYEKYLGDKIFTSNMKDLKGAGITVSTMTIYSLP